MNMRYRLRTLVMLTAIGPPMLACLWYFGPEIIGVCLAIPILLVVIALPVAVVAIPVGLLAFVIARIAEAILYFGRHPDNRR